MQSVSWDSPTRLERPRRVETDKFKPLADMRVAGAAGRACPAGIKRTYSNVIARREFLDPLTRCSDRTGYFVAENMGDTHALVHFPMEHVQVSPTNSAVRHLYLHLALGGHDRRAFSHANLSTALVISGFQHH